MSQKKRLGEIALLQRGLTYNKGDEVPTSSKIVLRSNNIDLDSHSLDLSELKYLREDFVIPEDRKVKKDSIFICMSNGSKQHVGKVAFIDRDMDYAFGGFMGLIVPKPSISAKYVFYACNSSSYRTFLSQIGNGIGITNLRFSELEKFEIPVPSIEEQQRIVDELDLLTGIIDKKNAQLRDLDALAQSIFYEMFGDIEDYDKLTNQLGDVCSIVGRIGFRGYTRDDFVEGPEQGAISLSPANIINGEMDYQKCSYVTWAKYDESPEIMIKDNDILVVKTGSSYGKTALVKNLPHKATINPQFVVLKDVSIDKLYLTAYLSTPFAKRKYEEFVIGTAIPTFSQKKLASMPLLIPSSDKQREFADKIGLITTQKEAIRRSITDAKRLLSSRMSHYFD